MGDAQQVADAITYLQELVEELEHMKRSTEDNSYKLDHFSDEAELEFDAAVSHLSLTITSLQKAALKQGALLERKYGNVPDSRR